MKKILVTGGSGFFGIPLVRGLFAKGHQVSVVDTAPFDDASLAGKIAVTQGDVRDARLLDELCRGMDYVVHNAAILPVSRSKKKNFWDVNVEGTRTVLAAALRNGAKKVIFISSSAPYGIPKSLPIVETTPFNPVCEYGRSKAAAEEVCREYRGKGLDVVIIRPRTIVGKGRLGLFQILYSWIADNKNIYLIGKGDNLFQLLSEEDLVSACVAVFEKPCKNEDFNLGADIYKTVREDLQDLIAYAHSTSKIISLPLGLTQGVLAFLDMVSLVPFTPWHYKTPHKPFYFDTAKAKGMLGWHPAMSNLDMFKASFDWYRQHRELDRQFGTTHRKSIHQRILKFLKKVS